MSTRTSIKLHTLWLMLLLLLSACQPGSGQVKPPEIAYGHDTCSLCGMIIDEPRYASAIILENGEVRKFDDIGDMFVYYRQRSTEKIQAWFVHDYESESWVRGEEAFYVISASLKTPMGSGIVAFQNRQAAEKFAAEHNVSVLSFEEVRQETQKVMQNH